MLKLYVWENVLQAEYGPGIMFALAESAEEARRLILDQSDCVLEEHFCREEVDDNDQITWVPIEPRCIETAEGFAIHGGG